MSQRVFAEAGSLAALTLHWDQHGHCERFAPDCQSTVVSCVWVSICVCKSFQPEHSLPSLVPINQTQIQPFRLARAKDKPLRVYVREARIRSWLRKICILIIQFLQLSSSADVANTNSKLSVKAWLMVWIKTCLMLLMQNLKKRVVLDGTSWMQIS